MKRDNLKNKIFGRLTVIELSDKVKNKIRLWKCICSCGNDMYVNSYHLNTGRVNSCGCGRYKDPGVANMRNMFIMYKHSAEKRKHFFNISLEEFSFITKQNCYYCGSKPKPMGLLRLNGLYVMNGIDRVDNNTGYVLDNCVPCCKDCNYAKRDMTAKEFIDFISRIYEYQRSKLDANFDRS